MANRDKLRPFFTSWLFFVMSTQKLKKLILSTNLYIVLQDHDMLISHYFTMVSARIC